MNGGDGGDAVGAIINLGTLTLQDTLVIGTATGGDGGSGGDGGDGGKGGNGGSGNNADGGHGGNGGSGSDGGAGGKGGSAVGALENSGTVNLVGAVVFDGEATAGSGGAAVRLVAAD